MNIEIVANPMPPQCSWVRGHRALNMSQKIGFSTRSAATRRHDLPAGDIQVKQKRRRSVTDIFEFPTRHLAGSQGQTRMLALQCLYAGHFIGADDPFAYLSQGGCLLVESTHIGNLDILVQIFSRREPVATQVRFKIDTFLKIAPHGGEKCEKPGLD